MFYRVSKFYNLDRKKPVYACHLSIFQNWQLCILNLPDTDGIIMYKTIYESSIVTSFLVDYLAGGKIVHNFFLNFFYKKKLFLKYTYSGSTTYKIYKDLQKVSLTKS